MKAETAGFWRQCPDIAVDELRLERELSDARARIAKLEKELAAFVNELDGDGNVVSAMVELKRLKAENEWHPASDRPTHSGEIMIASTSGMFLAGTIENLLESDKWREMPTPPKGVV